MSALGLQGAAGSTHQGPPCKAPCTHFHLVRQVHMPRPQRQQCAPVAARHQPELQQHKPQSRGHARLLAMWLPGTIPHKPWWERSLLCGQSRLLPIIAMAQTKKVAPGRALVRKAVWASHSQRVSAAHGGWVGGSPEALGWPPSFPCVPIPNRPPGSPCLWAQCHAPMTMWGTVHNPKAPPSPTTQTKGREWTPAPYGWASAISVPP